LLKVANLKTSLDALLINPISARIIPAFVPHGLLHIGSYAIEAGYNVAIYDRNVEEKAIADVIKKTRPKIVGLGCLTGTAIDDAIYVSKTIKAIDPSIRIVWGGIHATISPDSVLREDFVDLVVIGDGEIAFSQILDNVIKNKLALESIDNLGYKRNGQLIYNKRVFIDLNQLPLPAWHLIRVEKYIRKKFYADRVLTINTSRGCPYKCDFCCVPAVHQGHWRAMRAEKIIENLRYLKEHYDIDAFQVDDDEFDIDKKRVLKLCDLLESQKLNLKWSHYSRVNIAQEKVFKREIECGLRLVEFGIESGSGRMLKFLNKQQTLEQISNAYNICKKLRLKTSALFMIGLPDEEINDAIQTVSLVKRLRPHMTICTIYRPYPATRLFTYCIEKGFFRYIDKLGKIPELYKQTINTSKIDTRHLLKFQRYFDRRNIYQEIKFILMNFRVNLLFYYIKYYIFKARHGSLCKKI